jgi:hypothetical protein
MGRAYFGFSSEYKLENMWNIKTKILFGTNLIYDIEVGKRFENGVDLMIFTHGLYDNSQMASSIGCGVKKHGFSGTLHSRIGLDINATLQYTKNLTKNLYLTVKS